MPKTPTQTPMDSLLGKRDAAIANTKSRIKDLATKASHVVGNLTGWREVHKIKKMLTPPGK